MVEKLKVKKPLFISCNLYLIVICSCQSDPLSEANIASPRSNAPPTSPPARDLPPFEDESELIGGVGDEQQEVEEDDGEELFGDNLEA